MHLCRAVFYNKIRDTDSGLPEHVKYKIQYLKTKSVTIVNFTRMLSY